MKDLEKEIQKNKAEQEKAHAAAKVDLDKRAELEALHRAKDQERQTLKTKYDKMKKEYNALRTKEVDLAHQHEVPQYSNPFVVCFVLIVQDALKIVEENNRHANAFASKIEKLRQKKDALKIDETDEVAAVVIYTADELATYNVESLNTVRQLLNTSIPNNARKQAY